MTNAANVDLEPIWASLLAKALEGKNVKELLSNVGSGGGAPAAGGAVPAATTGGAAAEAPKEEEKKEEEKEESDDDMVRFGCFFAAGCDADDFFFFSCSIGLRSLRLESPHLSLFSIASHLYCLSSVVAKKLQNGIILKICSGD